MKVAFRRALTLVLALCLVALPALSALAATDTYLPDGEVTHVDFTLATALHPEGFPASTAHLADWATFLQKLDIKGSMDALAMLTTQSRVYVNGALRLNGASQIPFVYDGYHSYRYFMSPALGDEVLFFQMHNFLEFMLKPYYYMELPTQYLGLLMYPEASYYLGDSYYTPVVDTLSAAREEAAEQQAETREALLAALDEAQAQTAAELATATERLAELDTALAALAAATPTPEPTETPAPEAVATAAPVTDTAAPVTDAAIAPVTGVADVAPVTEATAVPAMDTSAVTASEATAAAPDAVLPTATPTAVEATVTAVPEAVVTVAPEAAVLQAERDALAGSIQALNDTQAQLAAAAQGSESMSLAALQALLPAYASQADDAEGAEGAQAEDATLMDVPEGATVYTVPYDRLYELCETLDLIANDDPDLERVYFYMTCLLTEQLASDMVVETLGQLEDTLDALDPEQNGMTVVETDAGITCTIGDTEVYRKITEGNITDITFVLPTADGYDLTFTWHWNPEGTGAALDAKAAIVMGGNDLVALNVTGNGLPREGDVSGQGQVLLAVSGTGFETVPKPVTFTFNWARDAKQKPYTLGLTLTWLHPDTGLPAISLDFNGTFSTVDRSVFTEGHYPQNDFFNLNETFLNEYKDRLLKPLLLKLAPILLETPTGVLNDLYTFAEQNDILVSLVE